MQSSYLLHAVLATVLNCKLLIHCLLRGPSIIKPELLDQLNSMNQFEKQIPISKFEIVVNSGRHAYFWDHKYFVFG